MQLTPIGVDVIRHVGIHQVSFSPSVVPLYYGDQKDKQQSRSPPNKQNTLRCLRLGKKFLR